LIGGRCTPPIQGYGILTATLTHLGAAATKWRSRSELVEGSTRRQGWSAAEPRLCGFSQEPESWREGRFVSPAAMDADGDVRSASSVTAMFTETSDSEGFIEGANIVAG
jgi:hypothetical protein